ncbi:MAG: thioesterase [Desulfobacterales bacterium]|nr:thioesterase [Desulfobacterales bacterium]
MIFEKKIQVRYAEIGIGGRLKPVSIFNYFQDIASEHTAEMGVSAWDLLPKGLAWVIFKYELEIYRYPIWKESLNIRTWRCSLQKLYELRKYEIYDEKKNLLIDAKSSWILTSLTSKKPVRIDRHLPFLLTEHHLEINNDLPALESISRADFSRTFQIRLHDLDFNRHVNNSIYPVWAIESVPAEILTTHAPQKIIINYIGESLYGDRILSFTQKLDSGSTGSFLHSLASEQTQKEITRIKTVWKENDENSINEPEPSA